MGGKNEGEGNKTAARHYNEKAEKFAQSGKVEDQARAAEEALEGGEARELEQAEAIGKSHAAGEDPAIKGRKKADRSA
jgi:hypothetical protein